MTKEHMLEETINAIADMMHLNGTLEQKCASIQKVFKEVSRMMPDMKNMVEKQMKGGNERL